METVENAVRALWGLKNGRGLDVEKVSRFPFFSTYIGRMPPFTETHNPINSLSGRFFPARAGSNRAANCDGVRFCSERPAKIRARFSVFHNFHTLWKSFCGKPKPRFFGVLRILSTGIAYIINAFSAAQSNRKAALPLPLLPRRWRRSSCARPRTRTGSRDRSCSLRSAPRPRFPA